VCQLVKKSVDVIEFSRTLFRAIPPEFAVRLFAELGVESDRAAAVLLEFGGDQTREVASAIADLVVASLPNSNVIFDSACLHAVYLERGLAILQALPEAQFISHVPWLVNLANVITGDPPATFAAVVDKVDPMKVPQFDAKCVLFARLVEWGFPDTVLRFASVPIFCRRFLVILLPKLSLREPIFCLRLAIVGLRFKGVMKILLQYDLFAMVSAALDGKQYDVAAQVMLNIIFPIDLLNLNRSYADSFSQVLERVDDRAARSRVCLTLVPFALQTKWMPTPRTVQIVGQLLQSADTTEIGRALLLAVAMAQNPGIAVRFADLGNVDLVCRFFKSDAPSYVFHTAARFLLALAPFVKLENEDTIVKETMGAMIDLALNRTDNPRLVLVCLQILVVFRRSEELDLIIVDAGVNKLLEVVGEKFPQDVAIGEMAHLLQARFRKHSF
jgi:hypothetical protein